MKNYLFNFAFFSVLIAIIRYSLLIFYIFCYTYVSNLDLSDCFCVVIYCLGQTGLSYYPCCNTSFRKRFFYCLWRRLCFDWSVGSICRDPRRRFYTGLASWHVECQLLCLLLIYIFVAKNIDTGATKYKNRVFSIAANLYNLVAWHIY